MSQISCILKRPDVSSSNETHFMAGSIVAWPKKRLAGPARLYTANAQSAPQPAIIQNPRLYSWSLGEFLAKNVTPMLSWKTCLKNSTSSKQVAIIPNASWSTKRAVTKKTNRTRTCPMVWLAMDQKALWPMDFRELGTDIRRDLYICYDYAFPLGLKITTYQAFLKFLFSVNGFKDPRWLAVIPSIKIFETLLI